MTWEHYDDLPFEVFCTDYKGERYLIKRTSLESEAIHAVNVQNRSRGYAAEYHDWRKVELEKGSSNMPGPVDAVLYIREVRCMLCNDCGKAQPCPGCGKVDPYLKAYQHSLVNDDDGDPNS